MIALNPSSVEHLVRVLYYIGGVASTIVGSLVSSKIRVYYDHRNAHHDEIKNKVLIPLRDVFVGQYRPLVNHKRPVVVLGWGIRQRKETASVTEYPNEHGPLLEKAIPNPLSSLEQSLLADAKNKHFRKLIAHVERFLTDWQSHVDQCHAWVYGVAETVLLNSDLPPQQPSYSGTYLNHYKLGIYIYQRLFETTEFALNKRNRNPGWSIEGYDGESAAGTEQEVDHVFEVLNELLDSQKDAAEHLRAKAMVLERDLTSLCSEIDYAIASRRLHKQCDLVKFL